jgi:citrate synthase
MFTIARVIGWVATLSILKINCLEMARQNAVQCNGEVVEVLSDGSEKKVFPEK